MFMTQKLVVFRIKEVMIIEDVSDLIKGTVAFGVPTTTFFGFPLQEWMYFISIFAALLLIFERLPNAAGSLLKMKEWIYARFKK